MSIEAKIEQFIVDEVMMAGGGTTIGHDESLISSGVLDSLSLLRLISFIEDEFGVSIDDGEVLPENFETIDDMKAFLERKMQ